MHNHLTQELVRELLDYDPETGILTWRVRDRKWFTSDRAWNIWNAKNAGKQAGNYSHGYRQISIFKTRVLAHRAIWLWMSGAFPVTGIDHKNHIRDDNRWSNLREATQAENLKNLTLSLANTSGVAGVSWDRQYRKWFAKIQVGERQHFLGRFSDKSEAIAARRAAEIEHGFHPNHGRIAA